MTPSGILTANSRHKVVKNIRPFFLDFENSSPCSK